MRINLEKSLVNLETDLHLLESIISNRSYKIKDNVVISKFRGTIEEFGLEKISYKHFLDNRGEFKKIYFTESETKNRLIDLKEIFFTFSKKGVIRGMHIQGPNHPMRKLIMVIEGEILDTIVDCRESSVNFGTYSSIVLKSESQALFIPDGFAHGYQVVSENATVMYLTDIDFCSFCDSAFNYKELEISWPILNAVVSDRDSIAQNFKKFNYSRAVEHQ